MIFQHLLIWQKKLFKTKDKKKNSEFVEEIKNRWSNLKVKTEKMSKEEIKNETPDDILEIVNEIKREIQKQGSGLKILKPNQMLSRLPISLAHLKAGNNSEKLKNEIRQILYSLYRSKNLQSNSIKVWLTLFKNGNNLYEH